MSSQQTLASGEELSSAGRALRMVALAWVGLVWVLLFATGIYINFANGRLFLVAVNIVLLLFPALLGIWYLQNN